MFYFLVFSGNRNHCGDMSLGVWLQLVPYIWYYYRYRRCTCETSIMNHAWTNPPSYHGFLDNGIFRPGSKSWYPPWSSLKLASVLYLLQTNTQEWWRMSSYWTKYNTTIFGGWFHIEHPTKHNKTYQLWVFRCRFQSPLGWTLNCRRPIQRCGWPGEETLEERRAETRAWCTKSYWTGMAGPMGCEESFSPKMWGKW